MAFAREGEELRLAGGVVPRAGVMLAELLRDVAARVLVRAGLLRRVAEVRAPLDLAGAAATLAAALAGVAGVAAGGVVAAGLVAAGRAAGVDAAGTGVTLVTPVAGAGVAGWLAAERGVGVAMAGGRGR